MDYPDIKEGKIVPVEITVKLLQNAMQKSEVQKFLVDGFPRSIDNYEASCPTARSFLNAKSQSVEMQGWVRVVGDSVDVQFCLFYGKFFDTS